MPTALVAEDEPAVQRLLAFWLRDAGYEVLLAGDGREALAMARQDRPDVIVTDALMPLMTGDELVEAVRADPDVCATPIVMATAAASPLRVRRILELGCHAVLAKPLDEDSFVATVQAAHRK